MRYSINNEDVNVSIPKGRKRKVGDIESKIFAGFFGAPPETIEYRNILYKEYFKIFNDEIQEGQEEWRDKIQTELDEFVEGNAIHSDLLTIPIGFLIRTGLDKIESSKIFKFTHQKVKARGNCVASISSKDATNSQNFFKNFWKQLNFKNASNDKKNLNISAQDLKTWYYEDRKNHNELPSIVVIIEDLDLIPPKIIQDFFMILSCTQIPFLFIVGVAYYTSNSFNKYLPQNSLFSFRAKTFKDIPATDKIENVINYAILNPESPFLLSGELVKYIKDYYLKHHPSINAVANIYKACILDHFSSFKSVFCLKPDSIRENGLLAKDLEESVKKYPEVNRSPPSEIEKGLRQSSVSSRPLNPLPVKFENLRYNLGNYHVEMLEWFAVLHFIYGLNFKLPNKPLGENFSDLYILCWDEGLRKIPSDDEDSFSPLDKFIELVGQSQKEELKRSLLRGQKKMSKFVKESTKSVREISKVAEFQESISKFLQRIEDSDKEEAKIASSKSPTKKLKKKMNLAELKSTLEKNREKKSGTFVFNGIRKEFIDYLQKLIKEHLVSLKSMKFIDIFLFDKIGIKRMISANLGGKITSSLLIPHSYLKCDCCEDLGVQNIHWTLPDVSILYKLVMEQECLTLDLNSLYDSFKGELENEFFNPEGPSQAKKRRMDEDPIMLRFRNAIAELQHTGLTKRLNKRKPDVLERVTFDQFFGPQMQNP